MAMLFGPQVEPSDSAIFAAGEKGVGVTRDGQQLVGRAGVTGERTAVRGLGSFEVWKDQPGI